MIRILFVLVEADESPTVVLDRADASAPSQRQPTVSPDPFRDVIKTEPAPDLPSLIEDMIPYLVEHGITTPKPTVSMAVITSKTSAQVSALNQMQHPPNFNFMKQVPLIQPPFDHKEEEIDSLFTSEMRYEVNRKVSPKDMVSLTYDSESQSLDHKPGTEATVFSYDKTNSDELNRTLTDNSKSDLRQDNAIEQKENVSHSDLDKNFINKVDDRITKYKNHTESNSSLTNDKKTVEDDTIFSLDSVLELLFSLNTSSDTIKLAETTMIPNASPVSGVKEDQEALVDSSTMLIHTESLTEETETVETSSKTLDNEIPMSVGSLLKLAGCNIYGRMYRVGRIITELSNPCLECKCTEIGVQCKQLEC